MYQEACCTCASLLSTSYNSPIDSKSEKAQPSSLSTSSEPPRRLRCCGRAICSSCITSNPRFAFYCPYCQVSEEPTSLPQGLRDPPAYTSRPSSPRHLPVDDMDDDTSTQLNNTSRTTDPPAYSAHDPSTSKPDDEPEDVTHHLHPSDTLQSISLAYSVPMDVLRKHNNLFSDHLLSARKTLLIPGSYYQGPSLSPHPIDDPEESERKAKIRRFMVGAKCPEYEMAELYLGQCKWDVDRALEKWWEDERWERENPYKGGKTKGKKKVGGSGSGLVGQLS